MHVLGPNILAKSGYSSGLNIEQRAQYMEDVGACVHVHSKYIHMYLRGNIRFCLNNCSIYT